jgi:S-formylglutathione hydrolase
MSSSITIKSTNKVCGGRLIRFSHLSVQTKTEMTCSVFLPNAGPPRLPAPLLLYLSGLTCTDENVCQKSGVFRSLAEKGICFVAPDTSPRGLNIPGDNDSWDFGVGAGFYVDATADPWKENYRMYSYITNELLTVLAEHFSTDIDTTNVGITGHSMGGHGALTIGLKRPDLFKSVSAFSPICNPVNCPWGVKAFTGYFGEDLQALWSEHDACSVITKGGKSKYDNILIDVGTADNFLINGQLLCDKFLQAAMGVGQSVTLRYQGGYDHSYNFISTFIEDHVNFHAKRLAC